MLFILVGVALIPYAGIQYDEALFTTPLYADVERSQYIRILDHKVPLMLMSYLGTLKSLLFSALLNRWRPGTWSLRVPVLVAGTLTVWIFARFTRRAFGPWAAAAGALLLASDAAFLLTTIYDWGPVALQHLLVLCGIVATLRGLDHQSRNWLGLGFFLFGLAMWDKALAVWMLSGLGVATVAIYPQRFWAELSRRNIQSAVAGFLIGALPLVVYNVKNHWVTFRGNAHFSAEKLGEKTQLLRITLEGGPLFGYIARDEWEEPFAAPHTAFERASFALRQAAGERRRSLQAWGLLLAVLFAPLWWRRRRPILFALIAMSVGWLQMAFTKDAGGGAHHTILLWPLPQFIIVGALAGSAERIPRGRLLSSAVAALLVIANLLVVNQYAYQFIRNGTGSTWTDAIEPLYTTVRAYRTRPIAVMDWGISEQLRAFDRGLLNLVLNEDAVAPNASDQKLRSVLEMPGAIFLTHTNAAQVNAGNNERLVQGALRLGYTRRLLHTINDRNGRPQFEIAEFVGNP